MRYIGRFAPSPTGLLHAGSLVAALASWLDARAHGGLWRVRMEDVDAPRCVAGADRDILRQLAACGLQPDGEVIWQSQRGARYQQMLEALIAQRRAYACTCSRKDIAEALAALGRRRERHGELVYPGTCRARAPLPPGLPACASRPAAWRLSVAAGEEAMPSLTWTDRRLGPQTQDVAAEVGDFVLRRSDGLWAYQLAVVVDDADEGITHVVRGEDLADNTARQIVLQRALSLPTPGYLHTPLVRGANGEKLSKQNGAAPLRLDDEAAVMAALNAAATALGLDRQPTGRADALQAWVSQWRARWALLQSAA